MNIRYYKKQDKAACLGIFDSNCPQYFDPSERAMFDRWLDHQHGDYNYQSPTYKNSICDAYYVLEANGSILGSGGFYVNEEAKEVRLAWGMIHTEYHNKGYGTALFLHRKTEAETQWKGYAMHLGTSQFTYAFYEKMGFSILEIEPKGYGPELDRIEMVKHL